VSDSISEESGDFFRYFKGPVVAPKSDKALPPETLIEAFEEVVRARRSVRVFDGFPVPDDVLAKCLDLTLLAPNSSNLQPWEFYVLRTPSLRPSYNAAFLDQPAVKTCGTLVIAVARTATWREHAKIMADKLRADGAPEKALTYYTKLVPLLYDEGPFGVKNLFKKLFMWWRGLKLPTPREPTNHGELQTWAVKTTALACENLMLALKAYGYDSCPMEGLDSKRLRKLMKLPRDAVIVMGVAAGKKAPGGVYGPQIRLERPRFIKEL
jgi:nitroreductase